MYGAPETCSGEIRGGDRERNGVTGGKLSHSRAQHLGAPADLCCDDERLEGKPERPPITSLYPRIPDALRNADEDATLPAERKPDS